MKPFSINIRGRLVDFDRPAVMGIINITPDSFYAASRVGSDEEIAARAIAMADANADILDLGAYSSRPGASVVPEEVEAERLCRALSVVRSAVGSEMPVSVDTFRASVARKCVAEWGADIINDISGGKLDPDMFETVAALRCPYILMHMRGTPATMQSLTDYADVTADVIAELSHSLSELEELGVADVIVDPGFGFAKTLAQNYEMMKNLRAFDVLGRPLMVGVSRKSMLTRLLDITADEAAPSTAVLGALAVERGASILRVHDVALARQSIAILDALGEI